MKLYLEIERNEIGVLHYEIIDPHVVSQGRSILESGTVLNIDMVLGSFRHQYIQTIKSAGTKPEETNTEVSKHYGYAADYNKAKEAAADFLKYLSREISHTAMDHGFTVPTRDIMLKKLMLVVTEVAEAAEAVRHENWENFAEELADTAIRILHICYAQNIDLIREITKKMAINAARPFRHGGKSA